MNADGSGQKRLTSSPGDDFGSAWSPDGKKIAFKSNRTGRYQIYVMSSDGGRAACGSRHSTADAERAALVAGRHEDRLSRQQVGGNYEIFVVGANGSGSTS